MPAGGLEIVHQEAAENRVGALGGKLFLAADLAGNIRRHPPDRDDLGRRHDQSAVLPRGLGYQRLLRFIAPAGQLGCG
jgi:hypothetical protein